MRPALQVDGLGKRYRIDGAGPRGKHTYRTLREEVAQAVRALWRRPGPAAGAASGNEDFWALRDVDLEVQPGEVVGIVGRNSAGKSTLLKILSRITKPTTGTAVLRGRVGSLLEVGTGFHPELSGRENVFLNGTILGMSRAELRRQFDEIVAFAEVERFLDMPVKRYSSGMYVRLAFAVAAVLPPEILIVDEVLAVGDMAFQRKCLGRMQEVGRSGRTVLFVTHNMPAVESLCTRAILLDAGRVAHDGPVPEVVEEYHRRVMGVHARREVPVSELDAARRWMRVLRSATLLDESGQPTGHLPLGGEFRLRLALDALRPLRSPVITIGIDDTSGQRLLSLCTPLTNPVIELLNGTCEVECRVAQFPLAPGEYWVSLSLATLGEEIDEVERAIYFTVVDGDAFGEGRGLHLGVCVAPSRWLVVAPKRSGRGGAAP